MGYIGVILKKYNGDSNFYLIFSEDNNYYVRHRNEIYNLVK